MLKRLFNLSSLFSVDMGIDLGTCNTLVCVRGKGIVLNEPSVVAIKSDTKEPLIRNGLPAVGAAAKEMLGKAPPGKIDVVRPLKDGVISDFNVTGSMLEYFIKKAAGNQGMVNPRLVIGVPGGITAVEKSAVLAAAKDAGASLVRVVPEPFAAAMGAELPVAEATASMIVDIGGGTTDVAIISLGRVAYAETVRVAGDEFDAAIVAFVAEKYKLAIGPQTAERIKLEIGTALPGGDNKRIEVRGKDMIEGLPRQVSIGSDEISQCLQPPLTAILDVVRRSLEKCDPELSADLIDNGIVLAGGGALLRGLPTLVTNRTGLDCRVAEEPLTCVVRGAAMLLEHLDEFKDVMEGDEA